jgi:hypothetical protein
MTVAVITRALLRVREHAVSLGHFLERLLRLRVARIFIRMIANRETLVRTLQLLFGRVAPDT